MAPLRPPDGSVPSFASRVSRVPGARPSMPRVPVGAGVPPPTQTLSPASGREESLIAAVDIEQVPQARVDVAELAQAVLRATEVPGARVKAEEVTTPTTGIAFTVRTASGRSYSINISKPNAKVQRKIDALYTKIRNDRIDYRLDIYNLSETYRDLKAGQLTTRYIAHDDPIMPQVEEMRDLYAKLKGFKAPPKWSSYERGARGLLFQGEGAMLARGESPQLQQLAMDDKVLQGALDGLHLEAPAALDALRAVERQTAYYAVLRRALAQQIEKQNKAEKGEPPSQEIHDSGRLIALKEAASTLERIDPFALFLGSIPLQGDPQEAATQVVARMHLIESIIRAQPAPRKWKMLWRQDTPPPEVRRYALAVALQGIHDRTAYEAVLRDPRIHDISREDPLELGLARAVASGNYTGSQNPPLGRLMGGLDPADRTEVVRQVREYMGQVRTHLEGLSADVLGDTPGVYVAKFRAAMQPAQPAADGSP